MESIPLSFLLSVAAGVVCHYLCKWLDERVTGNRQQAWAVVPLPATRELENPPKLPPWGDFCMWIRYPSIVPAVYSIAYALSSVQAVLAGFCCSAGRALDWTATLVEATSSQTSRRVSPHSAFAPAASLSLQ